MNVGEFNMKNHHEKSPFKCWWNIRKKHHHSQAVFALRGSPGPRHSSVTWITERTCGSDVKEKEAPGSWRRCREKYDMISCLKVLQWYGYNALLYIIHTYIPYIYTYMSYTYIYTIYIYIFKNHIHIHIYYIYIYIYHIHIYIYIYIYVNMVYI